MKIGDIVYFNKEKLIENLRDDIDEDKMPNIIETLNRINYPVVISAEEKIADSPTMYQIQCDTIETKYLRGQNVCSFYEEELIICDQQEKLE